MHNSVVYEALRFLVNRARHAKDTRQWDLLRDTLRRLRRIWRCRHLSNRDAIRRLSGYA